MGHDRTLAQCNNIYAQAFLEQLSSQSAANPFSTSTQMTELHINQNAAAAQRFTTPSQAQLTSHNLSELRKQVTPRFSPIQLHNTDNSSRHSDYYSTNSQHSGTSDISSGYHLSSHKSTQIAVDCCDWDALSASSTHHEHANFQHILDDEDYHSDTLSIGHASSSDIPTASP